MRSRHNKYFKSLMEDETILWLKANDPHYSDQRADKGLNYPYLTKRKELFRDEMEVSFSNLNNHQIHACKDHIDLQYNDKYDA